MIRQAVPLFQAGNLLTKEMLNAMKEYSFEFSELLFQNYSTGILCGCEVTTTTSSLQLNKGIIFYHNKLYLITQPIVENYYPTDQETFFKIKIKDEVKTANFIYLEMESVLDHIPAEGENEIEICRFKLQEGFRLRTDYQSFEDRITAYDTVNIVHSPFSTYGGKSLSPQILRHFADSIFPYVGENLTDQIFCMQIYQLGERAMNIQLLVSYLSIRLEIEVKEYSNIEIFRFLDEILREDSHGSQRKRMKRRTDYQVLLD